jgi:hypothetical protein
MAQGTLNRGGLHPLKKKSKEIKKSKMCASPCASHQSAGWSAVRVGRCSGNSAVTDLFFFVIAQSV